MHKLTTRQVQQAADFLKNRARPLERARYAYHFEQAPAEAVLTELAHFQNADGGFGHGLEADIRLLDSSVIATTVAFQRLLELNTPADHPLVVQGCRYLRETYNAQAHNWPIIPANVDDAPHADWWTAEDDLMSRLINPRAEVLGYLYDYAAHFPAAMREELTGSVIVHLLSQPDEMEMHDLLCALRLLDTRTLPDSVRQPLRDKLKRAVQHNVTRDPEGWRGYGLPPLAVVRSPDSPFAVLFKDEIPVNLDFIVEQQGADGSWGPAWSWSERWPDAWKQAENDWRGVLTLDNLRLLKAFGRIEAA
ncbi:MAG: hypothetical protein JNM70_03170 [Anaerolineae bacterium]|nr:hypothetical protein [Anaerolineae bacterium]